MSESSPSVECQGHHPACTHSSSHFACEACIKARRERGPVYCPDLDNCGGPGCMDHLSASESEQVTP